MHHDDEVILRRLHDAVNREIGRRIEGERDLKSLRKRIDELELEIRELLQALNRATADPAV